MAGGWRCLFTTRSEYDQRPIFQGDPPRYVVGWYVAKNSAFSNGILN